jgi:hypothetical protein
MKDQQMKFETLLAMLDLEQPGALGLAVGSWEEKHSLIHTQPMVAEHLGSPSQS